MEVIKFKITWYIYLNFPIIFSGRKRVFFFLHKRFNCLLCVVSCSVSSEEEDIHKRDYNVSPITPRSAAQLRLRFLSRVGQQVRLILFILHRHPKCTFNNFHSLRHSTLNTPYLQVNRLYARIFCELRRIFPLVLYVKSSNKRIINSLYFIFQYFGIQFSKYIPQPCLSTVLIA